MEEPKHSQPTFLEPSPAPVTPPPHVDAPAGGVMSELFAFLWETIRVVLVSLVIILPVRYFVIQPFFVSGSSMVPNYHDKEYILVDKWTYRIGLPQRGDVIIFHYPNDPKEYFIKRILGLPGETVLAGVNNTVQIFNTRYPKGFTVFEKGYLPDTNPTLCASNTSPSYCGVKVTLGDNEYFVMGDNREHSSDSRFFGPVNKSFFAGMAWLRLFPFNDVGFLSRTEYPPVIE